MPTLLSLFGLLTSLTSNAEPVRPRQGTVLHVGLVRTLGEHINFEIAQGRLRRANPDRRIITFVREHRYEDQAGVPRDLALAQLERDLSERLKTLEQPIELAYVQMNDLNWMRQAWDNPLAVTGNPVLALRGRLAPDARIVLIGHSALDSDRDLAAVKVRRLLDFLGAPRGSLIAQVTPVVLPYDENDFLKSPGRRLGASAVKGFGFAALEQLGLSGLGALDVLTYPMAIVAGAWLYKQTLPGPRDADTEVKPDVLPFVANFDDALFTAAVGVGTAAFTHGFAHLGGNFLNVSYFTHAAVATGVFFALSLVPKVARNLYVRHLERTRHRNSVRLFSTAVEAIRDLHANDPRNFDCARSLTGATGA